MSEHVTWQHGDRRYLGYVVDPAPTGWQVPSLATLGRVRTVLRQVEAVFGAAGAATPVGLITPLADGGVMVTWHLVGWHGAQPTLIIPACGGRAEPFTAITARDQHEGFSAGAAGLWLGMRLLEYHNARQLGQAR